MAKVCSKDTARNFPCLKIDLNQLAKAWHRKLKLIFILDMSLAIESLRFQVFWQKRLAG